MFYAPEYDDDEENMVIESVFNRPYPPAAPSYGDYIRGLFWLSPLAYWLAPRHARVMRKVWDRHVELCAGGKRERSSQH